jgi:hypothetical protein
MKINRKVLLMITAGLGILLIVYSLVRHFFKIEISSTIEEYFMNGIVFAALALFMYNRKLAKDERQAKEAAEKAESNTLEPAASGEDENLPHWERQANAEEKDPGDLSAED